MLKKKWEKKVKNMTICIGLLCDDKKQAVAIADRKITDDYLSIGFEHGESKIIPISKNTVAMCSGYTAITSEILDPVKAKNLEKTVEVKEIAEEIANSYDRVRKEKINRLYFKPRGLDISEISSSKEINLQLLQQLDKVIEGFEFPDYAKPVGLQILVVGVDSSAHIYLVDNPGIFSSRDSIGWMCIGSGTPPAENSLILNEYNISRSKKEAFYFGYEAKKWAEKSPEVGDKATDMAILTADSNTFLNTEEISQLKSLFLWKEKEIKPISQKLLDKVKKMDL